MELREILEALPHRYPFLMVDGVDRWSDDEIHAYKNVSFNEPQFQGHFPGLPIMPGVLIVEALAQAGGLLAYNSGGFDPASQVMLFMIIEKAKFRRIVRPGDRLDLEVRPLRKGRVWKLKGIARVAGEVAAEAEFVASIGKRDALG